MMFTRKHEMVQHKASGDLLRKTQWATIEVFCLSWLAQCILAWHCIRIKGHRRFAFLSFSSRIRHRETSLKARMKAAYRASHGTMTTSK